MHISWGNAGAGADVSYHPVASHPSPACCPIESEGAKAGCLSSAGPSRAPELPWLPLHLQPLPAPCWAALLLLLHSLRPRVRSGASSGQLPLRTCSSPSHRLATASGPAAISSYMQASFERRCVGLGLGCRRVRPATVHDRLGRHQRGPLRRGGRGSDLST